MTNHGGRRKGAGRKPSPKTRKVPITLRLHPEIIDYLRSLENMTAETEAVLRRSKGFRSWRRSSGDHLDDEAPRL